jgi:hypothetical protein
MLRRSQPWFTRICLALLCLACLGLPGAGPAESRAKSRCRRPEIHIHKGKGQLILTCQGKARLRASVSFGAEPAGHKQRSGDEKTPEGRYQVCTKTRSKRFHRFLGINYPLPVDARRGLRKGLITRAQFRRILRAHKQGKRPPWNTGLGGAVGIHGVSGKLGALVPIWNGLSRVGGLYRAFGLSDGCIVTDNPTIDRLWAMVKVGTPVYIHPIR